MKIDKTVRKFHWLAIFGRCFVIVFLLGVILVEAYFLSVLSYGLGSITFSTEPHFVEAHRIWTPEVPEVRPAVFLNQTEGMLSVEVKSPLETLQLYTNRMAMMTRVVQQPSQKSPYRPMGVEYSFLLDDDLVVRTRQLIPIPNRSNVGEVFDVHLVGGWVYVQYQRQGWAEILFGIVLHIAVILILVYILGFLLQVVMILGNGIILNYMNIVSIAKKNRHRGQRTLGLGLYDESLEPEVEETGSDDSENDWRNSVSIT